MTFDVHINQLYTHKTLGTVNLYFSASTVFKNKKFTSLKTYKSFPKTVLFSAMLFRTFLKFILCAP